jgi:hypothetical protein
MTEHFADFAADASAINFSVRRPHCQEQRSDTG